MMTQAPSGILFSPSVLHTQWFIVFAAFVGVNTIIYLGLTFSKLIPWPAPVHPRVVRKVFGIDVSGGAVQPVIPSVSRETASESGVHDIARGFAWVGIIVVLLGIVRAFLPHRTVSDFAAIGAGLLFLAIAQIVARTRISTRLASWVWALSISVMAIATAVSARLDGIERIGEVIVLVVLLGAVSLTWPSFVVAALLVAGSFTALAFSFPDSYDPAWLAPLAFAFIASGMLMVLHRRSLGIIEEVDRLENQLGSTDVLTGVLTRQGVLTLSPQVRRIARRDAKPLFLMIIDIVDLAGANKNYGTAYGDDLLRAVADVIKSSSRDSDLLGRWSGDEFVLVGVGAEASIEALTARIVDSIEQSAVAVGKWPLRVSIGTAIGSPEDGLDSFINTAMAELEKAAATADRA
jgi:diguanylate cyclase (GGDEF)-like protein